MDQVLSGTIATAQVIEPATAVIGQESNLQIDDLRLIHQHVVFIQHRTIHEFASIAATQTPVSSMDMPKEMQSGCDRLHDFCQLFAT